tara:strand:- start:4360 stop:4851 length:492 start_codon:yes stop_codon:yes gene_type:complete
MEEVAPLTEEQRNKVRSLLKQLGEASVKRSKRKQQFYSKGRKKRRVSKNLSIKHNKKKSKNPFDDLVSGRTIDGLKLPPICYEMTVVQRTRLILYPLFYDGILLSKDEITNIVLQDLGADLSEEQSSETLRFVIEGNPPIKYLYIHLEKEEHKFKVVGWMFVV